jgi:hypothetical protein
MNRTKIKLYRLIRNLYSKELRDFAFYVHSLNNEPDKNFIPEEDNVWNEINIVYKLLNEIKFLNDEQTELTYNKFCNKCSV